MEEVSRRLFGNKLKTKFAQQHTPALQKIDRFIRHPRHKQITRHGGSGALKMVNKKRHPLSRSLHERLQETFYPYTAENPIAATVIKRFFKLPSRPKEETHQLKSDCKTYGKWHGEIVHKQLENFANVVRKNLSKLDKGVDVYEMFVNTCGGDGPDPCSLRIINALLTQNMLPIHAEVPIWDEVIGVLSAIDLICVSLDNVRETILVEVKTGYSSVESYKETAQDREIGQHFFCRDPLRKVVNCPFHRASLQLLICGMIAQERYNITFNKAFIVRICPKTKLVYIDSLPKWALQNSSMIYNAMRLK